MKKCISCGTPPQPYYKDPHNSLTQNHASVLRTTQFAAGVVLVESFVIPQLGLDISVCAKNIVDVVIGSYLWNPAYGYLKIAHWDSCTGQIGLLNEDINGAAIPGTNVSEGSIWAVSARPCCADQDNFSLLPFLAENYQIPPVNGSVTLSVTSTYGLIEGTNVRIGSNVYYLSQINSSLEIVVENQGAGGTPGSTVQARDNNGDLQYLITQAVASACISPGSNTVRLIGCDGANEAILSGEWLDQVPVLIDPTTEEVEFKLLDTAVRVCTFLTSSLNILSGTPSYTISVDNESLFSIDDIIQIDAGSLRWIVTNNSTPGQLDITCTTGNPGSNFTVIAGSSVCLQLSIETVYEQVQNEIESGWVKKSDTATYNSVSTYAVAFTVPGDVTSILKVGVPIRLAINGSYAYTHVDTFTYAFSPVPGETYLEVYKHSAFNIINTDTLEEFSVATGSPPDFPAIFVLDPGAFTGFSSQPTQRVCRYSINNGMVDMEIYGSGTSGVSNSTSFSMPVPIQISSSNSCVGFTSRIEDNGVLDLVSMTPIFLSGFNSIQLNTSSGAWTASGDKNAIAKLRYLMDQ